MKNLILLLSITSILGCNIYQTGTESNPDNSNTYSLSSVINSTGIVYDLKIYDNELYIADGEKGVFIYDVFNIDSPEYLCHLNTFDKAYSLNKKDDVLYVADNSGGLRIINLGGFVFPEELSYYQTNNAYYLDRFSTKIVVADGSNGIKLIDVSNNYSPSLLDEKSFAGEFFLCAKFISENEIIAGTDSGLYIYKIENNNLILKNYQFSGKVFDFICHNNNIYAGSDNTIVKYEIVNNTLEMKDRLIFFDQIRSVQYYNEKLFIATASKGVNIVDIRNSMMNLEDNIQIGANVNSVFAVYNRLYIGDDQGVIRIYHKN